MMEHSIIEMERDRGLDRNAAMADMRYSFIENICEQSVVKCQVSKEYERSVQIDSVLTNRYLALPVFAGIMVFIFWMTFGPFDSVFLLIYIRRYRIYGENCLCYGYISP